MFFPGFNAVQTKEQTSTQPANLMRGAAARHHRPAGGHDLRRRAGARLTGGAGGASGQPRHQAGQAAPRGMGGGRGGDVAGRRG